MDVWFGMFSLAPFLALLILDEARSLTRRFGRGNEQ
jgi:hypothetical protein